MSKIESCLYCYFKKYDIIFSSYSCSHSKNKEKMFLKNIFKVPENCPLKIKERKRKMLIACRFCHHKKFIYKLSAYYCCFPKNKILSKLKNINTIPDNCPIKEDTISDPHSKITIDKNCCQYCKHKKFIPEISDNYLCGHPKQKALVKLENVYIRPNHCPLEKKEKKEKIIYYIISKNILTFNGNTQWVDIHTYLSKESAIRIYRKIKKESVDSEVGLRKVTEEMISID
jgi:hypothetical protein